VRHPSLVQVFCRHGITKEVALDCEFVAKGSLQLENMLARVSIVNSDLECLYDEYVKPQEEVTNYRTHVSGIRPKDIENGKDFHKVQKEVQEIVRGRILVGHDLEHDFMALKYSHRRDLVRDTSDYRIPDKYGKPKLKELAKELLGIDIQQGEHDSVSD
ncbi:unnamed protein product, partial [Gongylonema pulchrum]|uniref:RNA exonuclease 4 n=1 Tax=Gongylonema pulchrum TaxID=637853 RepID=A0A183EU40_9BILA